MGGRRRWNVTNEELRRLVRRAIARHRDPAGGGVRSPDSTGHVHPSHARLRVQSGVETNGPCLIEPTVACIHCGYCQSLGH